VKNSQNQQKLPKIVKNSLKTVKKLPKISKKSLKTSKKYLKSMKNAYKSVEITENQKKLPDHLNLPEI